MNNMSSRKIMRWSKLSIPWVRLAFVVPFCWTLLMLHRNGRMISEYIIPLNLNTKYYWENPEWIRTAYTNLYPEMQAWQIVDPAMDPHHSHSQTCTEQLLFFHNIPLELLRYFTEIQRNRLCEELEERAMVSVDPSAPVGVFFAHVEFGLGNRLRAIGSLAAYAEATRRALVILWTPSVHLNTSFYELFARSNSVIVIETFASIWPWCDAFADPNCHYLTSLNFMMSENPNRISPAKFIMHERDMKRHIHVKSAYSIKSKFCSEGREIYNPMGYYARQLLYSTQVLKIMRKTIDACPFPIHDMIGVHIRSRAVKSELERTSPRQLDHQRLHSQSEPENDFNKTHAAEEMYGSEGYNIAEHWRSQTNAFAFVNQINAMNSPSYSYFVTSDDPAAVEILKAKFDAQIFTSERPDCGLPRETRCVQYALVDMVLLSKTKLLLGSYYSSFSEMAQRFGAVRTYLAAQQFTAERPIPNITVDLRKQAPDKVFYALCV